MSTSGMIPSHSSGPNIGTSMPAALTESKKCTGGGAILLANLSRWEAIALAGAEGTEVSERSPDGVSPASECSSLSGMGGTCRLKP